MGTVIGLVFLGLMILLVSRMNRGDPERAQGNLPDLEDPRHVSPKPK
jgi:hypothetical protein